jgi:proteic killer suppression protein
VLKILNVTHRNLQRLHESGSAKGVKPEAADKLRKMFAYLPAMDDAEELRALATWKAHTLTGDRKGTWSLTVTRNHRLTFRVDIAEDEIYDVNLEDYH